MNNFKMGMKLMTYSVGFKRQILLAVFFVLLGAAMEVLTGCSNVLGGFYIAIVGSLPAQMLLLVTVPNVCKSSPKFHQICVQMYSIINFLCELLGFTIVVIIHTIFAYIHPENADANFSIVLILGATVCLTQFISPLMYKHYWVAFFLLMGSIMALFMPLGDYIYGDKSFHLATWIYFVGGYGFVVLGLFAGILVNSLFYKKELDPMTYKSMMKKFDGSM